MTVSDAILVRVEDWEGLYLDGNLVAENHTLDLFHELDGKTVTILTRVQNEADQNYVDNGGSLPGTWDDLLDHQYMWEEDHRDD